MQARTIQNAVHPVATGSVLMAAFTTFSRTALERYLVMFGLGELQHFQPIATGIENSNYWVTLDAGHGPFEYVLTITEHLDFTEAPFFNELLSQLAQQGLSVPEPHRTLDGMVSTSFCGKPTWLFTKLAGQHLREVNQAHCHIIGQSLAKLHIAAVNAKYIRSNTYSSKWAGQALATVKSRLAENDFRLLQHLVQQYASLETDTSLPRGIIHGDLFRDNALFLHDRLTGIIDFYHACEDILVQDIAIAINDWCSHHGQFDQKKYQSMLVGYESVRKLQANELTLLPAFQKVAAMRFALTRLLSCNTQGPLKDPEECLLLARVLSAESI